MNYFIWGGIRKWGIDIEEVSDNTKKVSSAAKVSTGTPKKYFSLIPYDIYILLLL